MSYYKTCPHCGAHLDPGETCDCRDNKKTALDAANIQSGKVEQSLTSPVLPPTIPEKRRKIKREISN